MFFGFDCDLYFSTRLETYRFTIFILQGIFDAILLVEIIRSFDCNLRFIGIVETTPGMIFSTFPGRVTDGFSGASLESCGLLLIARLYAHSSSPYRITAEQLENLSSALGPVA
jgi:hypothetical protein